jgi:hypothetical protein
VLRSALLIAAVLVSACGSAGGTGGAPSQTPVSAVSPGTSAAASASPKASASPSAASSPSASTAPSPAGTELVIADYSSNQVRLARLDASDTATVSGMFDGVVGGHVIVVNGLLVESLTPPNTLKKLGTLAGQVTWNGVGTVAVKPDLSQWVYTVANTSWTSTIHLGTPTSDHVVATIPSPDGNAFYNAYAWNASGVYFLKEATGLGGAGPFLEYRFPLARFDLASGHMTDVSPTCYAYGVLDEGTLICRSQYLDSHLQVRTQSGLTLTMQVTLGTGTNTNAAFWHVFISADNSKLVATRNGSTDPVINYQMAVAGLTESAATAFGQLDFVADTWLPDGRLVADHMCVPSEWGGGACNSALDGTYIFSADGSTHTLFYKLKTGSVVGYV